MSRLFLMCLHFPLLLTSPLPNNVCKSFTDYATIETNTNCYYNVDLDSSPSQLANRYGYLLQTYTVKTEDGYILSLFRILHKDINPVGRQPVVLQHGILSSGVTWLLLADNSLAFVLVKNGYDVWLTNSRGSRYSTGHENTYITEKQYWDFSFHEVGIYDLPAYIEFIAKTTGKNNNDIIYIGHSMGTSAVFVYASVKKAHAKKYLHKIIALSPIAYLGHMQGLIAVLPQYEDIIKAILEGLGLYAVGQLIDIQKNLAKSICNNYPSIIFCHVLYSLLTGLALEQVNPEMLPLALTVPSGTAAKILYHYSQINLANGRFQYYDYGRLANMILYKSSTPPEYPVEEISIPTHLFVGNKDAIATYKDASILYGRLKCNKSFHTFEMSHNDFVFGRHVTRFYQTLLTVMNLP